MAITLKPARQQVIHAYVDVNFSDVTSGVAASAIQLPPNAVVLAGRVTTLTAFNSATSDKFAIGDAASGTRYVSAAEVHATGNVALTPTGYSNTVQDYITVTWTGVSTAPTAGKVRVSVDYVVLGREQFSQG